MKPKIRKTFAVLIAAKLPSKILGIKSALAFGAGHRDLEDLHEVIDGMEKLECYLQHVLSRLILLNNPAITFRYQGVKD